MRARTLSTFTHTRRGSMRRINLERLKEELEKKMETRPGS